MSSRPSYSQQPHEESRKVYVVFRMDDYSAISDTDLESRILELCEQKQIGITFGVVPFVCAGNQRDVTSQSLIPLPPEKAELLKFKVSKGSLDIALHGYAHQTVDTKELSEFAGLDYEAQVKKLTEGRRFLEQMTAHKVKCFIPPWNSYDLNTVLALEGAGFEILSAGWNGVAERQSNIRFLPATCHLDAMQDAVDAARNSSDNHPVVVVLFHHYDFKEFNDPRGSITLAEFSDLLDRLKGQKDLRVVSIAQANEAIDDLSANRFLAVEHWRRLEGFLPMAFQERRPVLFYHEVGVLSQTRLKVWVCYGLIAVLSAISASVAGYWIWQQFPMIADNVLFLCILLTAGVIVYAFKNLQVSPKGLAASIAAIGASAGMLFLQFLRPHT
jgi:peptidoglycan/xylan/chitin deacetylase (PgdA/CDA1 family)